MGRTAVTGTCVVRGLETGGRVELEGDRLVVSHRMHPVI